MYKTLSSKQDMINVMTTLDHSGLGKEYRFASKSYQSESPSFQPAHTGQFYRKREITLMRELAADKVDIISRVDRLIRRRRAEKVQPVFYETDTVLDCDPPSIKNNQYHSNFSRDTFSKMKSKEMEVSVLNNVEKSIDSKDGQKEQITKALNFLDAHRIAMMRRRSRTFDNTRSYDYWENRRLKDVEISDEHLPGKIEFKTGTGTEMSIENTVENQIVLSLARDRDMSSLVTTMQVKDSLKYFEKTNKVRKQQKKIQDIDNLKLIQANIDEFSPVPDIDEVSLSKLLLYDDNPEETPEIQTKRSLLKNYQQRKRGDDDPNISDSETNSEDREFNEKVTTRINNLKVNPKKKIVTIIKTVDRGSRKQREQQKNKVQSILPSFRLLESSKPLSDPFLNLDYTLNRLMDPPSPTNNPRGKKIFLDISKDGGATTTSRESKKDSVLTQNTGFNSRSLPFSSRTTTIRSTATSNQRNGFSGLLFNQNEGPHGAFLMISRKMKEIRVKKARRIQGYDKYKHLIENVPVHNDHLRNTDTDQIKKTNPFFYENLIDYPAESVSILKKKKEIVETIKKTKIKQVHQEENIHAKDNNNKNLNGQSSTINRNNSAILGQGDTEMNRSEIIGQNKTFHLPIISIDSKYNDIITIDETTTPIDSLPNSLNKSSVQNKTHDSTEHSFNKFMRNRRSPDINDIQMMNILKRIHMSRGHQLEVMNKTQNLSKNNFKRK